MKNLALAFAVACVFAASGAEAGIITFQNGQGTWQSTNCPMPVPPSAMHTNSETAAAAMNRGVVNINEYSQASQSYMNCITQEAKMDADASGSVVMQSLAAQVQQAQDTLQRERTTMYRR